MSHSEETLREVPPADALRTLASMRGFDRWAGAPLTGDLKRLLDEADHETLRSVVAGALQRLEAEQDGLYPPPE